MLLNNADLENICEALHQMEFRCARNIHLLEDSFLSAVDQDSKIELAVLREQLQQYHATAAKSPCVSLRVSRNRSVSSLKSPHT